ncbi:winged helix-turn-helix domain-containing protein [Maribacter sp. 2-571]|uniref:winged helix-turn-helix domain-containing protein n=1 Tax=Maribacter sp. 2-571 TaxID=3417569 RepID=UPI003D34C5E8
MEATLYDGLVNQRTPKYLQLANSIKSKIYTGTLKEGQRLPSIVESSLAYELSRDTILRAYKDLHRTGLITSVYRKGYFVSSAKNKPNSRSILILINEYTSANRIFYQTLCSNMSKNNIYIDVKQYFNDTEKLEKIIDEKGVYYHKFLLEPLTMATERFKAILRRKTFRNRMVSILYEKNTLSDSRQDVFLDIEQDIQTSFKKILPSLKAYDGLNLILPENENFPYQIIKGFFKLCDTHFLKGSIIEEAEKIHAGNAYLVLDEPSLFHLMKLIDSNKLELGADVGLIAMFEREYFQHTSKKITALNWFNDSLLKKVTSMLLTDGNDSFHTAAKLSIRESL